MKRLIVSFTILLSACSVSPAVPIITPVNSTLTSLQQDVRIEAESLRDAYRFNMMILSDPSQTDKLLSIISLICQNLEQDTPVEDIHGTMLAEYGVVGSESLVKLATRHQCTGESNG